MLSGTAHLFANHVCAGQIGRDEGSLRGDHAGMKEGKELSDLLVLRPALASCATPRLAKLALSFALRLQGRMPYLLGFRLRW